MRNYLLYAKFEQVSKFGSTWCDAFNAPKGACGAGGKRNIANGRATAEDVFQKRCNAFLGIGSLYQVFG